MLGATGMLVVGVVDEDGVMGGRTVGDKWNDAAGQQDAEQKAVDAAQRKNELQLSEHLSFPSETKKFKPFHLHRILF